MTDPDKNVSQPPRSRTEACWPPKLRHVDLVPPADSRTIALHNKRRAMLPGERRAAHRRQNKRAASSNDTTRAFCSEATRFEQAETRVWARTTERVEHPEHSMFVLTLVCIGIGLIFACLLRPMMCL